MDRGVMLQPLCLLCNPLSICGLRIQNNHFRSYEGIKTFLESAEHTGIHMSGLRVPITREFDFFFVNTRENYEFRTNSRITAPTRGTRGGILHSGCPSAKFFILTHAGIHGEKTTTGEKCQKPQLDQLDSDHFEKKIQFYIPTSFSRLVNNGTGFPAPLRGRQHRRSEAGTLIIGRTMVF